MWVQTSEKWPEEELQLVTDPLLQGRIFFLDLELVPIQWPPAYSTSSAAYTESWKVTMTLACSKIWGQTAEQAEGSGERFKSYQWHWLGTYHETYQVAWWIPRWENWEPPSGDCSPVWHLTRENDIRVKREKNWLWKQKKKRMILSRLGRGWQMSRVLTAWVQLKNCNRLRRGVSTYREKMLHA